MRIRVAALWIAVVLPNAALAQQVPDSSFTAKTGTPARTGHLVLLDEAHHNFHTASGRYFTFAKLLRQDGYFVEPNTVKFTRESLSRARILAIANPVADANVDEWTLPTPSAFAKEEIEAVVDWVRDGGALLLIADHMPFPGATQELAIQFGVAMGNGYALDVAREDGDMVFRRGAGLADHPITRGRNAGERIDSLRSFTGQAFRLVGEGKPLMTLPRGTMLLMTQSAGQFSRITPSMIAEGMLQGAAIEFGKGRVAVFGEAAMFSAQLAGVQRGPMGMNDPKAPQNPQFLVNVLHWLSRLL
jgi:hypothetical protein